MKLKPRRPLDDDAPDGYRESDQDYVLNNLDLAVALLDHFDVASVKRVWKDREDKYTPAIKANHPMNAREDLYRGQSRWPIYNAALEAVSNRHGKYELVDLVNWLILRAKRAEFALWGISDAIERSIKKADGPHTFRLSDGSVLGGLVAEDVNRILTTLQKAADDGRSMEHEI